MSAQTGIVTPRGPASERLGDRLRFRLERWRAEPNPLWMREMRQSARLTRTPVILLVVTIVAAMVMSSIGGVMTGNLSPAEAGNALFHVFFSLAYFVVALIGPALAANSIASEREGNTWEAVLLTGLTPGEIARGKFLSAFTAIGLYVVMLAPVGATPFLFGGITPLEVLVAFVFLFLIALLSVAFGLAVSSKMQSLRAALLVTLLLAVPLTFILYFSLGMGLSYGVHELWPQVEGGGPIWLPTAYGRAALGLEYVVYLVALPIAAIVLPAWFLYAVTAANLTPPGDDPTRGLKHWYLVNTLVVTACATIPMFVQNDNDHAIGLIGGMCGLSLYFLFCNFLFAGEPIGPSRRLKGVLAKARGLRRLLGPGVPVVTGLQLYGTLACFAALGAIGFVTVAGSTASNQGKQLEMLAVFIAYAAGFALFCLGLSARLRAGSTTVAVPRVLMLVFVAGLSSAPWIVAAVSGVLSRSDQVSGGAWAIASPSPFYVFVALGSIDDGQEGVAVIAATVCAAAYALVGLLLMAGASQKCRKIVAQHEAILAEADRRLAEEDAARG